MSAAIITQNGVVRQLDRPAVAIERVTPEQWADSPRMSRLTTDIIRQLVTLQRRFWPMRLDFEDIVVDATGTKLFRLAHGFGGRVRWWAVDWVGTAAPVLLRDASTDASTLVLTSKVAGTVTIRVELAG